MTGGFTWYDLALFAGMAVTVWRVIVQNHVIATAKSELEKLKWMHAGTTEQHPPEPSPGEVAG
jgi:hypothetical protein